MFHASQKLWYKRFITKSSWWHLKHVKGTHRINFSQLQISIITPASILIGWPGPCGVIWRVHDTITLETPWLYAAIWYLYHLFLRHYTIFKDTSAISERARYRGNVVLWQRLFRYAFRKTIGTIRFPGAGLILIIKEISNKNKDGSLVSRSKRLYYPMRWLHSRLMGTPGSDSSKTS